MKKPSFTPHPLALMLGVVLLIGAILPVHSQSVYNTNRGIAQSRDIFSSGTTDSFDADIRVRLKKALPLFWASTQPGKTYMMSNTLVRRASDGNVTSIEKTLPPYTFGPQTSSDLVAINAPTFVTLLLGQYAAQSRQALLDLQAGLTSYFESTRPSQGTGVNGGQLMRNSDGSATFTDGRIIFVFNESTAAQTVATMAPSLAAALTNFASAILPGPIAGGYALRDPSNANQLINFDGRMYDTAGNALGNASAEKITASFGNGNGSSRSANDISSNRDNTNTGSASNGSGSTGSNANSAIGSSGSPSNGNKGSVTSPNASNINEKNDTSSASYGGMNTGNSSTNSSMNTGNSNTNGGVNTGNSNTNSGVNTGNSNNNSTSYGSGMNAGNSAQNSGPSGGANPNSSNAGSTSSSNATGVSSSTTGSNGYPPLTVGSSTATASTNERSNPSPNRGVCHMTRVLGGTGATSCD